MNWEMTNEVLLEGAAAETETRQEQLGEGALVTMIVEKRFLEHSVVAHLVAGAAGGECLLEVASWRMN